MTEQYNGESEKIYEFNPQPSKKKKGRKGLKIWIIVLVVVVAFGALISATLSKAIIGKAETLPDETYIAIIHVEGTIARDNVDSWGRAVGYQHDFTIRAIDKMIKDANNAGIILYVDSPGGGVYESDELYFKIKEYKESTNRPVFSYMASMAASGGYYISAPADLIFANRNCWTGSIGVTIGTLFDVSGFLENHGIKTNTITSGSNKSMGSMVDPLTEEQRAIFQSLVDEAYNQFIGIVAEGRNMDEAQVKKLADGRIYTAAQALDVGLIDGVSTYKDTISYIADNYDLEGVLLHDIKFYDNSFVGRLFNKLPLPKSPAGEAGAILSLIKNDVEFPISYLCEIL